MLHITSSGLTYIINITGSGFFTVWASGCWHRVCHTWASLVAQRVKHLPALQETWITWPFLCWGFPGGTRGKELTCQCRRHRRCGFDPWVGKIPRRMACNLLQYSCLENPTDRGAWPVTVHRVTKSQTWLKWLSTAHEPSIPTSVEFLS